MPFAINLRSDNDSSLPIRALWAKCSALEDSGSMEALEYPPHITFVIYENIEVQAMTKAMTSAFNGRDSPTIRFEGIDYFESPDTIVLWAKPVIPAWIWSVHTYIHTQIDTTLCRPHYRPGHWVPHCSLALSISQARKAQALELVKQYIEPFEVRFDIADCASFMPVKILQEVKLRVATED
jgi:2'-5' RNA ligase